MYVVLPSNSSGDFYSEIKSPIDYTVHLPASIDLVGEHEIALAEVLYSNSWFDIDQKSTYCIYCENGADFLVVKLEPGFDPKLENVVSELTKLLVRQTTAKQNAIGHVSTEKHLNLNLFYNEFTQLAQLQIPYQTNPKLFYIAFTITLARVLGFEQHVSIKRAFTKAAELLI